MELYRKYAPKKFSEVAGQSEAKAALTSILSRPDYSGGVFYLCGSSGIGKSSIAAILTSCVHKDDLTRICGADVGVEFVRELRYTFALSTWGASGWKACVIDEAHAMSNRSVV